MKRGRAPSPRRDRPVEQPDETEPGVDPSAARRGGGPPLSGGDVDADWQAAESTGEEAVGGSVATPDQDVVDEIGRALGVEQEPDAEVTTSAEILRRRDRFRWHLERDAEARDRDEEEEGRDVTSEPEPGATKRPAKAGGEREPLRAKPKVARRRKAAAPKKRRPAS